MLRIDVSVPDTQPSGYQVPADNPFVSGPPGGASGDLELRAAEPVALQLRRSGARRHRRAPHRRRRAGRVRRDRLRAGEPRRPQLRLAESRRRARQRDVAPAGVSAARRSDPRVRPRRRAIGDRRLRLPRQRARLGVRGRYFFADIVQGRVWSIALTIDAPGRGARLGADGAHRRARRPGQLGNISSFGVDADGELYIVSLSRGAVLSVAGLDPSHANGSEGHSLRAAPAARSSWLLAVADVTPQLVASGSEPRAANTRIHVESPLTKDLRPKEHAVKRPAFWILLGLVSLAATAAAVHYFPQAFSIVALDITMTRERALDDARAIVDAGPAGARRLPAGGLLHSRQRGADLRRARRRRQGRVHPHAARAALCRLHLARSAFQRRRNKRDARPIHTRRPAVRIRRDAEGGRAGRRARRRRGAAVARSGGERAMARRSVAVRRSSSRDRSGARAAASITR